jgi:DNA helicase IV
MTQDSGRARRTQILDAERAVNEQYMREIKSLRKNQSELMKQIVVVRSQQWTGTALPRPGIEAGAVSAVIGRVALEEGHHFSDSLGDNFYVASWRLEAAEFETVNWAAPIASLFFEGRASEYGLAPSVLGRRTFVVRLDDLVDYYDEEESPGTAPFDRKRRHLEIPSAPKRWRPASKPLERVEKPASGPVTEPQVLEPEETTTESEGEPAEVEEHEEIDGSHALIDRVEDLRAPSAVLAVIEMPKTGRMGVVLPTMQPDQYRFVSWPADQPLIVQGQPGTGKTVIAAHRAVYLTSEEREATRIARVALVGPSDNYVEHVAPIVSELKEPQAEIRILSLLALLQSIVGLRNRPKPGAIGRIESSWELGRAVENVVRSMALPRSERAMERRVRQSIEAFRDTDLSMIDDDDIRSWLRTLPAWTDLSAQARYLPMLATVALTLNPRAAGDLVGHLIVDEAQDVRPLEWRILTNSLLAPGGRLSLFGDMNQRRSDWTGSTWHAVARDLELTDDHGHSTVGELVNAYRSTKQILRFANRLLPRGARGERGLREGPEPDLRKVPAADRARATVEAATELGARYAGFTAVISVDPTAISNEFRRRRWVRGRLQHGWTSGGRTVVVLHPDEARGLEFDAAIVVEPSDFPENVGRQGVLYTSLTRANKELAVVYSRPLPRELQGTTAANGH